MKRLITVLSLGIAFAWGQTITPIADIQYVADPATNDTSALYGQVVTVSGVVTAEHWGTYKNRTMWIQDADTAWSGIYGYKYGDDGWNEIATFDVGLDRTVLMEGDSVTITATVDEYNGLTELVNATELIVHGQAVNPPAPIEITTLEANDEKYEGVLVKVTDVNVSNPDAGWGEWTVTDGSGDLTMDDNEGIYGYYYYPTLNDSLTSITGVMYYGYGLYKLVPRIALDIVEAGPYTRVQAIQQVHGSKLKMADGDNPYMDQNYFEGDTVTCIGIVTVPVSEISGITLDSLGNPVSGYNRFIWQDPNGGPYSSLLCYWNDPTAFPELIEGDSVRMTGWIGEYGTTAQFTEFWVYGNVEILGVDAQLPPREVVTVAELKDPFTAEQHELNMVRIENATVVTEPTSYAEFGISDATTSGYIYIGAGTNSMEGTDVYGDPTEEGAYVPPPIGTTIQSVEGYVYQIYGSWSDSTTYELYPVYHSDIVLGGGPPSITGFTIAASALGPTDAVTVSATITDKSDVVSAALTYRVDSGSWTEVAMTEGADSVWTVTIPATNTEGALVEYFIKALDDGLDNQDDVMSTFMPPDTSQRLYGYHTKAAGHTIVDIQTSPMPAGASYYDGQVVTVTGTVTTRDGSSGSDFVIQSAAAVYSGILCNDTTGYEPMEGDNVTVTGTVTELWWQNWDYKYGDNTLIRDISEVVVNSSGNVIAPMEVTAADLAADEEAYEGILVTIGEATVTSLNTYDWSVDDGTGEVLVDDDWTVYQGPAYEYLGALAVDDVIPSVTGIWNYSFGTFKIQVRDMEDLGGGAGVADNGLPLRFSLSQNYPNPFNPTTTIEYTLARQVKHSLKVYNLRGALVATLVNDVRPAGAYSVTWNANRMASGIYFLRLDAEDFQKTRKLILLK